MARTILKEEEEKEKIQNDVRILNERLSRLNDSLTRKIAAKAEYDKTIRETETAYVKVFPLPFPPLLPFFTPLLPGPPPQE